MNPSNTFKIVTLGEAGVGKTSIITRITTDKFVSKRKITEDVSNVSKAVLFDSIEYFLDIWDTVGQERFRVIAPNYYRGAVGALLVYDITDKHSFDSVVRWVNELSMQGEENVQIMIIGNKMDLESDRKVAPEVALDYAKLIHVPHLHVSAKSGDNIEEMVRKLTKMIVNSTKGKLERKLTSRKTRGVSVDRRISNAGAPKSKCC